MEVFELYSLSCAQISLLNSSMLILIHFSRFQVMGATATSVNGS